MFNFRFVLVSCPSSIAVANSFSDEDNDENAKYLLVREIMVTLLSSNRKLVAHVDGHADWPAGLRIDRTPKRASL